MNRYGLINNPKSSEKTRSRIENNFHRWSIEEYRLKPPKDGRTASVEYYIDEHRQYLECTRFNTYAANLVALEGLLEALRLAHQRGILEELAKAAVAMLPSGVVTKRPAHEVLGVYPDSDIEVAEAAYNVLAKKYHPDKGGNAEKMKELNLAIEEFKEKAIRARAV